MPERVLQQQYFLYRVSGARWGGRESYIRNYPKRGFYGESRARTPHHHTTECYLNKNSERVCDVVDVHVLVLCGFVCCASIHHSTVCGFFLPMPATRGHAP
jgi:hypothetical protein